MRYALSRGGVRPGPWEIMGCVAEAKAGTAAGEARVREGAGGGRKGISRGGTRLGESLGGRRDGAHGVGVTTSLSMRRRHTDAPSAPPPPSGSVLPWLLPPSFLLSPPRCSAHPTLDNPAACFQFPARTGLSFLKTMLPTISLPEPQVCRPTPLPETAEQLPRPWRLGSSHQHWGAGARAQGSLSAALEETAKLPVPRLVRSAPSRSRCPSRSLSLTPWASGSPALGPSPPLSSLSLPVSGSVSPVSLPREAGRGKSLRK